MKADLSRSTFDPARHVKRVPLQQGRVQTDADANEQLDVVFSARRPRRPTSSAAAAADRRRGFGLTISGADLLIGAGRLLRGGVLVENKAEVAYDAQPFYPLDAATRDALDPDDALGLDALAEPPDGEYLATLDVWEWHRTALEEPAIREVALGGPDTATRTRVLGQVKLHALEAGETANCVGPIASWEDAVAPSTGQLSARTDVRGGVDGPVHRDAGRRATAGSRTSSTASRPTTAARSPTRRSRGTATTARSSPGSTRRARPSTSGR